MLNATLVGRQDVTNTLTILRVQPDDGVVKFLPGQYLALGLPVEAKRADSLPPEDVLPDEHGIIKRTYSISSSPDQTSYYEFYIAILPQGCLTARLAALKEGERLFIGRKPVGTFTLAPIPVGVDVLCFATGTGIAPFVSMLNTNGVLTAYKSFTLVHGVRYSSDFAYGADLRRLAELDERFRFLQIVSRVDPAWQGQSGYVQDFVKSGLIALDASKQHIMLCGNPAMIDELEGDLCARGFSLHSKKTPGNIHLERYW